MKNKKLKIGLCTGGGDCPGLNAAIRSVVRSARLNFGMEVLGIKHGLTGLLDPATVKPISLEAVEGILGAGGTILGTNNQGSPFKDPHKAETILTQIGKSWRHLKLDGMIVIGGDGTQFMAKQLATAGYPIIGIPKTIDNDLIGSDQTIGFATAVDIATEAACRLATSAEAHSRVMVLEVMGRDAGHIALHTALACSANGVLLPEIPFSRASLVGDVKKRRQQAQNHYLLIAAEGAKEVGGSRIYNHTLTQAKVLGGIGAQVAAILHAETGLESRSTVLGHIQRGGSPNTTDRILATKLGVRAVELIAAEKFGVIVGMSSGKDVTIPYRTLTDKRRLLSKRDSLIKIAEATGINLGR